MVLILMCVYQVPVSGKEGEIEFLKNQKKMINYSKSLSRDLLKNQNHIIGIEYITAAASGTDIAGKFGHSMLRFVDDDGVPANDIVLSFEALTPTSTYTIQDGIFGGYSSFAHFDTFSSFWTKYVRDESRPLYRYIIPTNILQRNKLIETLYQYSENPSILGGYTFFDNNCAGMLANLFIQVGISSHRKFINGRIPVRLETWLAEALLSPYPALLARPPLAIINKLRKVLKLEREKEINAYNLWPANSGDLLLKNFSREELLYLYQELWDLPYEISSEISKKYNYRNGESDFSKIIGMRTVENQFYQICEDLECGVAVMNAEKTTWGEATHEKQIKVRLDLFWKYFFTYNGLDSGPHYEKKRINITAETKNFLSLVEAESICTKEELTNNIEKCL